MRITPTERLMLEREAAFETEQKFQEHVRDINWKVVLPVTDDYDFMPRNPGFVVWSALVRFVVNTFAPVINWVGMGTRVRGRNNLRGIKRAVVTCNHVHGLDNMMVRQAIRGHRHRLYITVADFNSRKDLIGHIMRGGGTLPFSRSITAMRNLNRTIEQILSQDRYLLCFPEGTLWWRYEKVRPFMDGAFHYAAVSNVPVVPMFITWSKAPPLRRLLNKRKVSTVHILEPIFPKPGLTRKAQIQYLREAAFEATKKCYEEFYGTPLVYDGSMVQLEV